jgi:hypothetical protein
VDGFFSFKYFVSVFKQSSTSEEDIWNKRRKGRAAIRTLSSVSWVQNISVITRRDEFFCFYYRIRNNI